jgi:formylglycine-generating enzyme required for sulfatase activity
MFGRFSTRVMKPDLSESVCIASEIISDLSRAHWRSLLDAPQLNEVIRGHLWAAYGAPTARLALWAVAQILRLEIPEPVRGKRGRLFRDCPQCPEMVEISPGYFFMGSQLPEFGGSGHESPRRLVTIDRPFAAGRFEVTFDEWEACVADRGCTDSLGDEGWGKGRDVVFRTLMAC